MFRLVVTVLFVFVGFGSHPHSAELNGGVAVTDITPPPGWRMSGYFNERFNTGTHDPLQAKAIYLGQGTNRVALVFCDLMGVPRSTTEEVRRIVGLETDIPSANVMVAATHSHTGPLYFDALHDYLHQKAVVEQGKDSHEPIDYAALLARRLGDAVKQARRGAKPIEVATGLVRQWGLSFNRRFHMKEGPVVFNPGKMNTNIVAAAGPIDPDLAVVSFRHPGQVNPFSLLTVFALHLDTTGGTEYGADYPYYLEGALRKAIGPDLISIFGAGTCGDLNHIDVFTPRIQKGGEESKRIGERLALDVAEAIGAARQEMSPKLVIRTSKTNAPLQEFPPEKVREARARMSKIGTRELTFLEQVEAFKIINVQNMREASGSTWPVEVQAIRIGKETAVVGLPGEIFVEFGLAIKRLSPFRNTIVIELCNDYVGYVPTLRAFAEGSYETVNSRLKPGAGELMTRMAANLLEELKLTE